MLHSAYIINYLPQHVSMIPSFDSHTDGIISSFPLFLIKMSCTRSFCTILAVVTNRKLCLFFRPLLYQVHLHAGTDAVLNVTFIRAPSHAWLKVEVPLMFIGDDVSPGLKKGIFKS